MTITGGEITGGAAFGPRRIPGDALDIDTTGTVTITGGEIRGGAQNGDGTRGGFVGNIRNAQVEISGGTFDGVFGRSSLGLIDVRNSTITGGAFNGGDEGFATDAFMTPTGEGDGLGVTGDSVLAIFDGLFTAGDSIARDGGGDALATSLRSNVTIFGGTFIGGLDMHSGERGDALSAVQNSVINVRGGTFLGTADLIQDAQLNIFGFADLLFDGTTVTGTLLSGDAINLDVRLLQNAQVNLNVIPLPAGAWLLLSGLAAMGAARRFRRA
ncbi:MAG: VPLPA-CTERM sorting domain-containing protein [Pseudomonadota bacterium]